MTLSGAFDIVDPSGVIDQRPGDQPNPHRRHAVVAVGHGLSETGFAKLPEQFGFAIEYTDSAGNLRYYEPDFVVLAGDGIHYIVETKGLEDTNVANKDRAAQLWCENTTRLAGMPWAYLKVLQAAYKELQPTRFEDLFVFDQKKLL
jgi:hypothetical protein